jgi:short subunit dehydrogenase-like uncharacterized protein
MNKILIYGANGYTGELITRFAAEQGLKPILAGRTESKIRPLAENYGFDFRVFSLDIPTEVDAGLAGIDVVIHCAGPFSLTCRQMVEACLRTKTHYLDITGEIVVFETMARLDGKAKAAGIMVMPGVGFDVVPSDCLARHLKDRLPSATHLTLAFYGLGRISHGTQSTMTMNAGSGGAVRRDGEIVKVPAGYKTKDIDFGDVRKPGVTIPWGDVSTAYHTTGIPNIEVYTVVPKSAVRFLKMSRYMGWLLAWGPVNSFLRSRIPAGGPSDEERERGRTYMWGEARDGQGNRVEARQKGMEGYTMTALAALRIAGKVAAGDFKVGFQTPAGCYGADLVLELDGVTRWDD